jgi:hypothetical protein
MHYFLALRELVNRGLGALASLGAVWVCSWAIRRAGEFDRSLDLAAKLIRWALVVVLLGAATYYPGYSSPRLALGLGGMSFLAWPNFAYHLTRFLRWCRILPKAPQPPPDPPSRPQVDDPPAPFRSSEPSIFGFTQDQKKNSRQQTYTVKWK